MANMKSVTLLICALLVGRDLAAQPSFDVASMKVTQNPNTRVCKGGPGTSDPGMWSCSNVPISYLIQMAYDLQPYRMSLPNGMRRAGFDVAAKIPTGTTAQQFRQMQQQLLVTRFHLKFHYEPKEMPVSELSVSKPGKLKQAEKRVEREFVPGPSSTLSGKDIWNVADVTMDDLAQMLALRQGGPVTNATALPGHYDIELTWAAEIPSEVRAMLEMQGETITAGEGGPTLRQALQDQLGLKLDVKKGKVPVMVVDSADKTPVEN